MKLHEIVKSIYHNPVVSRLMPTLVNELRRELAGCDRVLDLGCGPSSPIQHCKVGYSVGVEAFKPYLERSRAQKIHTEYLESRIEELDFPPGSFDAVIMIEVLEHLPDSLGLEMLSKAEKWASKKVVVSSPNGFVPQKDVDGNPLQRHLSGWGYSRMREMGFSCRGLAGLKVLRQEVESDTMGDDLTSSMRFWPRPFWFVVAAMSQAVVYYIPNFAFELFCVKAVSTPQFKEEG